MTLVRFRLKQTNANQLSVLVFVSFISISALNITFISTREVTWKFFSQRKDRVFFK